MGARRFGPMAASRQAARVLRRPSCKTAMLCAPERSALRRLLADAIYLHSSQHGHLETHEALQDLSRALLYEHPQARAPVALPLHTGTKIRWADIVDDDDGR